MQRLSFHLLRSGGPGNLKHKALIVVMEGRPAMIGAAGITLAAGSPRYQRNEETQVEHQSD